MYEIDVVFIGTIVLYHAWWSINPYVVVRFSYNHKSACDPVHSFCFPSASKRFLLLPDIFLVQARKYYYRH
jgi:hypothetical protein